MSRQRTSLFSPYFIISDKQIYKISKEVIDDMISEAKFDLGLLKISVSEQHVHTVIDLCLGKGNFYAISGFPCYLNLEDALKRRCLFELIKIFNNHFYLHKTAKPRQSQSPKRSRPSWRLRREHHDSLTDLHELGVGSPRQERHSVSSLSSLLQQSWRSRRPFWPVHRSVSNGESAENSFGEAFTSVGTDDAGNTYRFPPGELGTLRRRSADEAKRPSLALFSASNKWSFSSPRHGDTTKPFDRLGGQTRLKRSISWYNG